MQPRLYIHFIISQLISVTHSDADKEDGRMTFEVSSRFIRSGKSMIRHIRICGYPSIMISNQVIFDLFSSLIGKNPDEDARLSAMRRLSVEAGVEVEYSKEMFEKIMGRAQRIHSEMKPLRDPARKKVLSRMWTIPSMTPQVKVESEVRSYRKVVRLYHSFYVVCVCIYSYS